jgi:hypothetical protein
MLARSRVSGSVIPAAPYNPSRFMIDTELLLI